MPAIQTVEVSPKLHSTAIVSSSGSPANYTLTATVGALGTIPPTGTVSFLDALTNRTIASAPLDSGTLGFSLTPPTIYTTNPGSNQGVAVGDLNGDGVPDLVFTAGGGDLTPPVATVMLGDPAHPGQFLASQSYAVDGVSTSVAVGDFNGDGVPDLAATCFSCATLSVLLGDPTHPGQFLPPQSYPLETDPTSVVVGDFDGDGLPDIALANGDGISVLLNNPASPGRFLPPVPYLHGFYGTTSVAVGDFNGDGVLDLVAVGSGTSTDINQSFLSVLLGDPAHPGQFLPPANYSLQSFPGTLGYAALAIGDFNADGIPDIAVAWNLAIPEALYTPETQMQVFLGDPAHRGQFLQPDTYVIPFANYPTVATGDFNGDGTLDLAVPNVDGAYDGAFPIPPGLNSVDVYLGDVAHPGHFLPSVSFLAANDYGPYTLVAGDFNGDGLSDIATTNGLFDATNSENSMSVLLGTLTEAATASHVNPGTTNLVYAAYPGDENYYANNSCEIGLSSASRSAAPVISGVTVSNVTQTSATLSWTSNVPTYGGVNYGTSTALGSKTPWVDSVSTTHSFVLTNLTPGTTYYYQVWSVSYFNGCTHWTTFSPEAAFMTARN